MGQAVLVATKRMGYGAKGQVQVDLVPHDKVGEDCLDTVRVENSVNYWDAFHGPSMPVLGHTTRGGAKGVRCCQRHPAALRMDAADHMRVQPHASPAVSLRQGIRLTESCPEELGHVLLLFCRATP